MRWPEAASAADRVMVRAGVPHPSSPELLEVAREHSIPILVSANAFSRTSVEASSRGEPWTFRQPSKLLQGLDVALDSGGFVAMSKYNGYLWSIPEYLDLVASHDWTWWAAMDLCVEKEVAGDRIERRLRIAQSARNWYECAARARDRGLSDPLPVLQGQTTDDFLVCADLLPLDRWPALIGIGSMCRRDLGWMDFSCKKVRFAVLSSRGLPLVGDGADCAKTGSVAGGWPVESVPLLLYRGSPCRLSLIASSDVKPCRPG